MAIYHIVTVNDLKNHTRDNYYKPPDFDKDGFIHCTAGKDTALLVLEDYFVEISRSNEIVILEIDESKIKSEVKYEPPALIQGGGTRHAKEAALFPHIYGCLNIDAITGVGTVRRVDNKFVWPVDFAEMEMFCSPLNGCFSSGINKRKKESDHESVGHQWKPENGW
jgi:uncharacterized protein (DUF952 family)